MNNHKNFNLEDRSELQEHFWLSAPKQHQHLTEFTVSVLAQNLVISGLGGGK